MPLETITLRADNPLKHAAFLKILKDVIDNDMKKENQFTKLLCNEAKSIREAPQVTYPNPKKGN